MAYFKEATIERFIGLSTDTKPTPVRVGSTFFEYDTKILYISYDGDNWASKTSLAHGVVDNFILADTDLFDVADADADNERWSLPNITAAGYLVGTEGASADINTTTAGKLMVKVDPDATPTEARAAIYHNVPLYADYFTVIIDLDTTWGVTNSATAKAAGIIISKGTTYDSQNYIALERQKGTAINRFTASGKLNNVAVTPANANTTDDVVALKIERWDNIWRCYYSTIQSPNFDWVLLAQFEDPSVFMTNQITLFLEAYSVGSADTESVQADFDNFEYYIGSGGGGQYIAGDYSSAWVTADKDGSVLERLEYQHDVTELRTVAAGSKLIGSAATKYLSIDSLTNGAEILSIIIKGVVGAAWTLAVYIPTADAVAAPAAADKRDAIIYLATDMEGGLIRPFGIICNAFLNFTNNGVGDQTITDAVVVYRSRTALTLAWEA